MFVFDSSGRRADSAFGAPPGLHERIASRLADLSRD
jgi:hypothetical protein